MRTGRPEFDAMQVLPPWHGRKGALTKDAIVAHGVTLATEIGLSMLTIGALAERVGMSKSGLFAHFGAKEKLQLAVLAEATARFEADVARPNPTSTSGVARLQDMLERWLRWTCTRPGGCPIIAAICEFDARPGTIQDRLRMVQSDWLTGLRRVVGFAVESGELPESTDTRQFAFEAYGVILSTHHQILMNANQDLMACARAGVARLLRHPPLRA